MRADRVEVDFRRLHRADFERDLHALMRVAAIRNAGRDWYTRNTHFIEPQEQIDWFLSGERDLWVADYFGLVVGYALLDHRPDGTTWIGLGVDPAYHGRGIGEQIYRRFPSFAEIRADNIASRRAAEKAGYVLLREDGDKVVMRG